MRVCAIVLGMVWITVAGAVPSGPEFHRAVYALHEKEIANRSIRTEEERGQYEGAAAARYGYVETRYYDATTGALISRVRRDAANADYVHIAEVNLYNSQGKLIRDYGSISMPWSPLQPMRTFINLHHYHGDLHSFRQYDIFGKVGYEFCEGKFEGKPVKISIDGSDINEKTTASADYRACFGSMPKDWERFAQPH